MRPRAFWVDNGGVGPQDGPARPPSPMGRQDENKPKLHKGCETRHCDTEAAGDSHCLNRLQLNPPRPARGPKGGSFLLHRPAAANESDYQLRK
ncbi:hypothetical protein SKAU_G00014060 [Synaphobranchus kaupii]|uniref:Uncharacterized protein n=1 Tax=Synaphobranchus kaupii TaxID=118154 RepID=A0A9Q1GBR5_SYNKA|nr:hypothetical protein SKAU_G00014060 [Synaphobranchus kaupii]